MKKLIKNLKKDFNKAFIFIKGLVDKALVFIKKILTKTSLVKNNSSKNGLDRKGLNKGKKVLLAFFLLLFFLLFLSWRFFLWLQPLPGRTNFLLLGVAGGQRSGSDLADTIMFISVEHQTGEVLALSLPRDIWLAPLKTKLNSIYHYQGLEESKRLISELLGQPIDYGLVVDFDFFTKVIDVLGGVEVEVETAFIDNYYPLPGRENDLCNGDREYRCRYEILHFEAGKQNMNGERALKFARSRFAEGDEGTDFARLKRQQQVALAIKEKAFSPDFLFSYRKVSRLLETIIFNIQTDIPSEKYRELGKAFLKIRTEKLTMKVLNEGYLINPPPLPQYNSQWVLIPEAGNWQKIQEYVASLIFGSQLD